ncbi:uridine kinase family protein [Micromonospora sp. NPDC004704]
MAVDVVDQVAAAVASREPVNGIRIIGIDGPSGSGKSHLGRGLSEVLKAPIIEIDDFVSWDNFAGWWPRFDAQVLTPLLRGESAHYQARDWTDWYGNSLGEWKTQPWAPIVIFEGVTCTRRETIGRLAYTVWVDAPAPLRLARGLARDRSFAGAEQLWQKWMTEEEQFFHSDATQARANLMINTAHPTPS